MTEYLYVGFVTFGFLIKIFHLEIWVFSGNGKKYMLPISIGLSIYGALGVYGGWLEVKNFSMLCVPLIQLTTLWGCYKYFNHRTGMTPKDVFYNWNMSKDLEVHRIYGMLSWILMVVVMGAWLIVWI